MKNLLKKFQVGVTYIVTENQVNSLNLSNKKFFKVDPSEILLSDVKEWGLGFDISDNYIELSPKKNQSEYEIQTVKFRFDLQDEQKCVKGINTYFGTQLKELESLVLQKDDIQIKIFSTGKKSWPGQLNFSICLNIQITNNYELINPKYWVSLPHSDKFDIFRSPSFFSFQEAKEYAIKEVLKRTSVGRYTLDQKDVEENINEDGYFEVSVWNQMEDSKSSFTERMLIKRIK